MSHNRLTQLVALFFIASMATANAQVIISEFLAINNSVISDPDFGEFGDWIEIQNAGVDSVDLGTLYVTDNRSNLTKWSLNAGGILPSSARIMFWADKRAIGLHTNFKLGGANEAIYLTNGIGVIDSVRYDVQYADISYGREDGSMAFTFFNTPTPGVANGNDGIVQVPRVQFSAAGGLYDNAQNITLSVADQSATIYYTKDGSQPTASSLQYSNSLTVTTSTPIRAVAVASGKMNSVIVTNTYLIGENSGLPVVMLSADPDHFFGDQNGIYVEGTNGVDGLCSDFPVNWNMNWERPVNFEYYRDGQQQLSMMAGTKIMGGCSRINDMKSLSIKAKSEYEGTTMRYPFFDEKPEITEYQSLLLRNSGNDFNVTMFRDAMAQRLVKDQMDLEYQAYQPVHMYLNGDYWGLHNLRERHSTKYIEENSKADGDSLDWLEKGENDVRAGDSLHFLAMRQYWRDNDISQSVHYNYLQTQMEVENYVEYMIAQIFFRNTDWPGNNIRFWRPKTADGKWRWMLYDTDFGFGLWNNYASHNTLEFALENDSTIEWPNPPWSTELFRHLMTNTEFRALFLDRFLGHLATTFQPQVINTLIDEMEGVLAPEIGRHFDRWGGDMLDWYDEVDKMRTFGNARTGYMLDHLSDEFGVLDQINVNVTTDPGAAHLKVNNVISPVQGFSGQFFSEQSIELTTSAIPGYEFVGWRSTGSTSEVLLPIESEWKYLDDGSNQGSQFSNPGFDDSNWSFGVARFGYGSDGEVTEVSYGDDPDLKHATTYFRTTFDVIDTNSISEVTVNLSVDDGAVVYLNGVEVLRSNMAAGPVSFDDYAIDFVSAPDETSFTPYIIDRNLLIPGVNVIAVEVHQSSGASSDMGFDLSINAAWSGSGVLLSKQPTYLLNAIDDIAILADFQEIPPISGLFINELVSDNGTGLTDASGKTEDWIEFYNSTAQPINLGGLFISDTIGHLGAWRIPDTYPDSTTVPAYGHLTVFADKDPNEGIRHVNFKLGAGGEQVLISQLINGDTLIIDSISFGPQAQDVAYGRYPDGSTDWVLLSIVTPTAANIIPEPIANIYINEFMAGNDSAFADNRGEYDDWIELYNANDFPVDVAGLFLSDSLGELSMWQIPYSQPDSTTIPAHGFLLFWADKDPEQGVRHVDFSLGDKLEDIVLSQYLPLGVVVLDQYSYGNQWRDVSTGRFADGGNSWEQFNTYTPGTSNVRDSSLAGAIAVNEILANSVGMVVDEFGEYDDYIELYNLTDQPVDIGGLWITDTSGVMTLDRIPSNRPDSTTIPPNGFITLWADNQPNQGVLHLEFKLNALGEEIGVVQVVGPDTSYIDQLAFVDAQPDISFGRYSDGAPNLINMATLTPTEPNVQDIITVADLQSSGWVSAFPNPAKSSIDVRVTEELIGSSVSLTDLTGQMVKGFTAQQNNSVNLASVPAGIYLLSIEGHPYQPLRLVVVN